MARRDTTSGSSGGLGVFTIVGVIFVVLKLLKVEPVKDWSWWWVLSPFWIGLAFVGLVILIVLIALGIRALVRRREQ